MYKTGKCIVFVAVKGFKKTGFYSKIELRTANPEGRAVTIFEREREEE